MKKITLLMALLMWSSSFYGQHLTEGFEGDFLGTGGWKDQVGALHSPLNTNVWTFNTARVNTGARAAHLFDIYGAGVGEDPAVNDRWLVSPVLNLVGAVLPELTFYENVEGTAVGQSDNEVHYSTDYDGTNFGTATWLPLLATGGTDNRISAEDTWIISGPLTLPTNATAIAFRYNGENSSTWWVDDVLIQDKPSCVKPSFGSFTGITTSGATFNWVSGPTGTETLWDIELVDITAAGSATGTPTTSGITPNRTHDFSSLPSSNEYNVYVRADCGGSTSAWAGPFAFTTTTNIDLCSGAQVIVPEVETANAAAATNITLGTIDGATGDGSTSFCAFNSLVNNDVWYSFIASTANVNITVTGNFDSILELFSTTDNTCDTLSGTAIFCSDQSDSGSQLEEVTATGLNIGETYYFRIYGYANPSGRIINDYSIKLWTPDSPPPLGTEDLEKNDFNFYPNPVQDKLNLRAQDTIENISVYNLLGQEVMRQAPRSNTAELDMSALQSGAYFVKVTINDTTETKQIIKR